MDRDDGDDDDDEGLESALSDNCLPLQVENDTPKTSPIAADIMEVDTWD